MKLKEMMMKQIIINKLYLYQNKWILIFINLLEVLIAFKVVTSPWSGFVEYVTSTSLSPSSWVKPIIDPERYYAPPKPYCEVV